uniref:Uncharacterized protein n=1 Tax=Ditylenchus dipsaci TaxID=166011 RepID=A0A915DDY7_9BILA
MPAKEERDDSPDPNHLCIAEEEGPKSPTLSPPIQTGFINKVLTIPLETSKEEGELDSTTIQTSKTKADTPESTLTPSPKSEFDEKDDHDFRDVWRPSQKGRNGDKQRPKLSDQQPMFVPQFTVPPPRLIENPIVNAGVNRIVGPVTVNPATANSTKPVRQVKPFGSEPGSPGLVGSPGIPAGVGPSLSNMSLSQFLQFDRVPPSSPSTPLMSSYLMHRLDVPPPVINRPPPGLTNPLVVVDPRLGSLRLPIEPTRAANTRELTQSLPLLRWQTCRVGAD